MHAWVHAKHYSASLPASRHGHTQPAWRAVQQLQAQLEAVLVPGSAHSGSVRSGSAPHG